MKVRVPDDLGPAWFRTAQALARVAAETEESAPPKALLVAAIRKGHLRVFTSFLEEVNPGDDWGLNLLPASKVQSLGYAYPDMPGPTNRSYALTNEFWRLSQNLESDEAYWDWQSGTFMVGRVSMDGSPLHRPFWQVENAVFSALEVEALIKLHQSKMIVISEAAPAGQEADRGGRRRSSKWDAWTAELLIYYREVGFGPEADPGEIAGHIDDKLAENGVGKIDRRDAVRTIDAVLKSALFLGKPQES